MIKKTVVYSLIILLLLGVFSPLIKEVSGAPSQRDFYLEAGTPSQTSIGGVEWRAQSFTASSGTDYLISHVILRLCKSAPDPNTLTVHIRATESGTDLSTGTINADTFDTYPTYNWYTINMSSTTIEEGEVYWIVLDAKDASGGDSVYWRGDMEGSTYTLGEAKSSNNSGSTWTQMIGDDLYFEVWGNDANYITVTHTPNDSPLIKSKIYNFQFQTFVASVGTASIVFNLEINSVDKGNYTTGLNGIKNISLYFTTIGTKNVTVTVYNLAQTEIDYTSELSYTVIENEGGTSVEISFNLLANTMIEMLPLLVCIMLPAFFGGSKGGTIGFLLGAVVGVVIAIGAELLPFYFVYLLALVIIMGFIFVIRSTGSGGQ